MFVIKYDKVFVSGYFKGLALEECIVCQEEDKARNVMWLEAIKGKIIKPKGGSEYIINAYQVKDVKHT